MSSPIAKNRKSLTDRLLIKFHKKVSHANRVNQLSDLFVEELSRIHTGDEVIRLLDVGCGDMSIAKSLALKNEKISFMSIDIYPNKEGWENYVEFDGRSIPFSDQSFDVALFSDVLHHDYSNISTLLSEAKRVAKYILIKDHFEYGLLSRNILRLADFIGNYGYGVSIPKRYLSKKSYYSILQQCDLEEFRQLCPIQLYEKSVISKRIFRSKYQFISIIRTCSY